MLSATIRQMKKKTTENMDLQITLLEEILSTDFQKK